jgi:adenylyltransferase/sulfurtransferase
MTSSFVIRPESNESPFDRQERLSWWKQDVLRQARILIIGAGALGNEALKNLALLGAGRLLVVDFDTISASNLSRTLLFRPEDVGRPKAELAAQRARELMLEPTARIQSLDADLVWDIGLGLFRRMDVILGCVDNDEARLAINRAARSVGTPWINAGIYELAGSVTVFSGTENSCFECNITSDQVADAQSRYDSCEQVKKRYLEAERLPTVQVTSALISALQVQEAVKLLHQETIECGVRLAYNGLTHGFHRIRLPENPDCLAHGTLSRIVESPAEAKTTSLGAFLDWLEQAFGTGVQIDLGRRFIEGIRCRSCHTWIELNRPAHRVFDDEVYCPRCRLGDENREKVTFSAATDSSTYVKAATRISRHHLGDSLMASPMLDCTLWDLGIPQLHILSVTDAGGQVHSVELTGDTEKLLGDWNQ